MNICYKHGRWFVFCHGCDYDTIEEIEKLEKQMVKNRFTFSEGGLLTFPKSTFDQFRHTNTQLRWGQSFHQFMKLDKCAQDKVFADRLHAELSDEKAKAMVISRLDKSN